MDTTLLILAAASLVALPLAGRLLVAVQQGWRPGARLLPRVNEAGHQLRVVARAQLSPQHSLHLIETDEGTLLVSCSPKGTHVLDRRTRGETPAPAGTARAATGAAR